MDKQYAKAARPYAEVSDEEDDVGCSEPVELKTVSVWTETKHSSKEDTIHNLAASRLNLNLDNIKDRKINNIIKKAINDIKKL